MSAERILTLLFTDIQGSTRLLDRLGDRYRELLREHHRIMREAIAACGGTEVETAGDSFFVVFEQAGNAVWCAVRAQQGLARQEWPGGEVIRVRMGIHTGAPALTDGGYVGMDVHRAARVMSVAHGGQVLLTEQAMNAMSSRPSFRDVGYHRLKDLPQPEHLFQLVAGGLGDEFPELRSLNRSNVPTPPTPIIGRSSETGAALEALARPDTQLLTLIGPGGVGKTRLAIEIATEAVSAYPDGVWMVSLASVQDDALIAGEIANVLDIDEIPGEPASRTLVAGLSERALLLVVDNAEHLRGVGALVAEVLSAAPRVKVLCTSREPLALRSERRMDVAPLALVDARTLFLTRAASMRSELSLDDDDQAAVDRICSRLDGLPLAIELAAARVATFRPKALELRLAARLSLPSGPHDLPERQRTLRATIDWSYQLLDRREQDLFSSLSPFIGGIRLDAAEVLWGPDGGDALLSLAAKSLLNRGEDGDGEPRFRPLETVREFSAERAAALGSAEVDASRHAEHFCALAAQAAPQLKGADQGRWLDRLDSELPNVRAALDHLSETDPPRGLLMTAQLIRFWEIRGHVEEGRRRLGEFVSRAPVESDGYAAALFGAGRLALLMSDPSASEPLLVESSSVAEAQGDRLLAAEALSNLSWAYTMLGDNRRSVVAREAATAMAREAGDARVLSITLNNHGDQLCARGDFRDARPLLEEALAIRRRLGEPRAIALTAANLASVALEAAEVGMAKQLISEGLSHARAISYGPMIASLLSLTALVALLGNDVAAAQLSLGEAAPLIEGERDAEIVAEFLTAVAVVVALRGETRTAATLWAATDVALVQVGRVETPAAAALRRRLFPAASLPDPEASDAGWQAAVALELNEALTVAVQIATAWTTAESRVP